MTIAQMPNPRSAQPAHSSQSNLVAAHSPAAQAPLGCGWFFRTKEFLDRLLGLLLLVPALPMIAILVVAIRLTSRGPGVYRQVREGKQGRIFTMYKLRSMRLDAEAKSGPTWSASGADPRVTWLGFWLRRLHLDELPQLLNVVRGEMALVGPRPERPEFVKVLAEQIPGYEDRLVVLPGITGLAQINLPPDSDLDSVRRKLIVDVDYIETAGFWLDGRILFCTLLRMFWIKGPAVTRVLGLERVVILPASAPPKPASAAVSLDTLVMKNDETVTDFTPTSDSWQATRRADEAQPGNHLQVAAAAAQDA
jgi:lipopolysaccharide/colanic/teichoic acid biosynthesis glycosyltransferase